MSESQTVTVSTPNNAARLSLLEWIWLGLKPFIIDGDTVREMSKLVNQAARKGKPTVKSWEVNPDEDPLYQSTAGEVSGVKVWQLAQNEPEQFYVLQSRIHAALKPIKATRDTKPDKPGDFKAPTQNAGREARQAHCEAVIRSGRTLNTGNLSWYAAEFPAEFKRLEKEHKATLTGAKK